MINFSYHQGIIAAVLPLLLALNAVSASLFSSLYFDTIAKDEIIEEKHITNINQLGTQQQHLHNLRRIVNDASKAGPLVRKNVLRDILDMRQENSNVAMPQEHVGISLTSEGQVVTTHGVRRYTTAQDGNMYSLGSNVTKEEDLAATRFFLNDLVYDGQNGDNAQLSKDISGAQPVSMDSIDSSGRNLIELRREWRNAWKPRYYSSTKDDDDDDHVHTHEHGKGNKKGKGGSKKKGKGGSKKKKDKSGKGKGGKGKGGKGSSPSESPHHHPHHQPHPTNSPHSHNDHPTEPEKKFNKFFTLLLATVDYSITGSPDDIGSSVQLENILYSASGKNIGRALATCVISADKVAQCNYSVVLINNGMKMAELQFQSKQGPQNMTQIPLSVTGGTGTFSGARGSAYEVGQSLNIPVGCNTDPETSVGIKCVDAVWYVSLYEYYDHNFPTASGCTFC